MSRETHLRSVDVTRKTTKKIKKLLTNDMRYDNILKLSLETTDKNLDN